MNQQANASLADDEVGGFTAADIPGIRATAVHAKDNDASAFCRRFDFVE